jgi:Protein of unknown function (DUF664)
MSSVDLLTDGFGRVREVVHGVVDGLSADDLAYRLDPEANTIGWLVWHLTRVQDDHIADAAGSSQVWLEDSWQQRFGLSLDPLATGFGHGPEEVAEVRVASPDLLIGYHDAVCERTVDYIRGLTDEDFARIVDEGWDPPVTLGVRLVSILSDDLQHAGQAAYVRGVLERR